MGTVHNSEFQFITASHRALQECRSESHKAMADFGCMEHAYISGSKLYDCIYAEFVFLINFNDKTQAATIITTEVSNKQSRSYYVFKPVQNPARLN